MVSFENGFLIVKQEDDEGVDDYDKAKSTSTMPYRFGIYILPHSERLMNEVINQLGGTYNNSVYYNDTDSVYNHNK